MLGIVLGLLLVGAGVVSYRTWLIVDAVVQVEQEAIVPLPTRDATPDIALATSPTPPPAPSSTVGATVPVSPTAPDAATGAIASTGSLDATPDASAVAGGGDPSHISVLAGLIGTRGEDGAPVDDAVWQGRTSLNVLLLGVDRRADGGDQNSDVMILAHIDLAEETVSAVSIPRDLVVTIPGVGEGKINGAYNAGVLEHPDDPAAGVAKLRDTIEQEFGITVDGYVLVDFAGFTQAVDAIGGIEIDVPAAIVDNEYPTADYGTITVTFSPGIQQMDGERALQYVRTRHADSDDARRERQFQVLMALFTKASGYGSLANAQEVIKALDGTVQTSFTVDEQFSLARLAMRVDEDAIRTASIGEPLVAPGWTDDGIWVYRGDPTEVSAYLRQSLGLTDRPETALSR